MKEISARKIYKSLIVFLLAVVPWMRLLILYLFWMFFIGGLFVSGVGSIYLLETWQILSMLIPFLLLPFQLFFLIKSYYASAMLDKERGYLLDSNNKKLDLVDINTVLIYPHAKKAVCSKVFKAIHLYFCSIEELDAFRKFLHDDKRFNGGIKVVNVNNLFPFSEKGE